MNLHQLHTQTSQFSMSEKMPVLFVGHGSPMNAIEENQFVEGFREASKKLPVPNAILCISAHWFTEGTLITSGETQKTIHDFYGFPKELFEVEYPVKGDIELARKTVELALPNEVLFSEEWGLDHGAWSVLKHMYPDANIPVIQMSIDYRKPPQYHFELAAQLRTLRKQGVLIVGSGNIVHNLGLVDWRNLNTVGLGWDWAVEAREKTNQWILDGDFEPLIRYHKQGSFMKYAVPTPEHFLPLIYTLGLKDKNDEIALFNDELIGGSLSMTSVKLF